VNTTADVVGADGRCSLREAIAAANADAAPSSGAGGCPAGSGQDTIRLPAGTYRLVITGASEDNDASGDLDIRAFAVTPIKNATPKRGKRHAHFGTTFDFRLTEAARVTVTIEQALPGRQIGRTCRPQTKQNSRHRRCTPFIAARRFTINARKGSNATKFSGRIGRTALKPGSYRAALIATDTTNRHSARSRLTFRIVKL
jgi:CSLREA domain-containing protein